MQNHSPQAQAAFQQGNQLFNAGQPAVAIAFYSQAVSLDPTHFKACFNWGNALRQLGQPAAALEHYQAALAIKPDYLPARNNLALVLKELGQLPEAVQQCQLILRADPTQAGAWYNLGNVYRLQGQAPEAENCYRKALQLKPEHAGAALALAETLGRLLFQQGRFTEASAQFQAVIQLQPQFAPGYNNLGACWQEQGELAAAITSYETALHWRPDYAEARYNRAQALLLQGDFQAGYAEYEASWRQRIGAKPRELGIPAWRGEDLEGRTLLLYAEQGLGDTLQMIRFVPWLARQGAQVVFECPPPLVRLMETVAGIGQVVPQGEPLPWADVQASLLQLPLLMEVTLETVPREVPYLGVAREGTPPSPLLPRGGATGDKGLRRIGFVWAGNPQHLNDFKRSCPLAYWRPLFELPGIEWYSLQVGERGEDLYQLEGVEVIPVEKDPVIPAKAGIHNDSSRPMIYDLSPAIQDFADTAAIISQLDLIISVDTAVAHLAGALAKPVWILLSHIPDWRWMLKRSDSPWYPTARLFRQSSPGDWDSVIAETVQAMHCQYPPAAGLGS